jgi:hypothetical protein
VQGIEQILQLLVRTAFVDVDAQQRHSFLDVVFSESRR